MRQVLAIIGIGLAAGLLAGGCGTGGLAGYQHGWVYPEEISSVYVEMFDTTNFRRGYEFTLTEAVCKHIEARTPYKIVSDRAAADSILTGTITATSGILAGERYTGGTLENEAQVQVRVTWKNLKTGRLMLDNEPVFASASYSYQMGQDFDQAANAAITKAAQRIVEKMERPW